MPPAIARSSRSRHARFLQRFRSDPQGIDRDRDAPPPVAIDKRASWRRYRDWLWPRRRQLAAVALLGVPGSPSTWPGRWCRST